MAKEPKKLDELFHDTLRTSIRREEILAALPKIGEGRGERRPRRAFESTTGRRGADRTAGAGVEAIARNRRARVRGHRGILEEGHEIMRNTRRKARLRVDGHARARGAGPVEHYEISRYAARCAWAESWFGGGGEPP